MVDLGMPAVSLPSLAPRRKTRQLQVGSVAVGSEAQVSVQSMCTTLTSDVDATLQQIAELTAAGCQIVRVAVPSQDDADALAQAIARVRAMPAGQLVAMRARARARILEAFSLDAIMDQTRAIYTSLL